MDVVLTEILILQSQALDDNFLNNFCDTVVTFDICDPLAGNYQMIELPGQRWNGPPGHMGHPPWGPEVKTLLL